MGLDGCHMLGSFIDQDNGKASLGQLSTQHPTNSASPTYHKTHRLPRRKLCTNTVRHSMCTGVWPLRRVLFPPLSKGGEGGFPWCRQPRNPPRPPFVKGGARRRHFQQNVYRTLLALYRSCTEKRSRSQTAAEGAARARDCRKSMMA